MGPDDRRDLPPFAAASGQSGEDESEQDEGPARKEPVERLRLQ